MANTIILSRQGVSKHSYISTKKHPQNKSWATSSLTFYFSHCINSVCLLYYYYYNYYYNYYYSLGNSYNNQTLKTMLVLVSARKHTVIYTFYVQRPTLVIVTEPATWNRLPATLQSSDCLQNFKNQLKAHFFWWTAFSFFSIHLECGCPWTGLHFT